MAVAGSQRDDTLVAYGCCLYSRGGVEGSRNRAGSEGSDTLTEIRALAAFTGAAEVG